MTTHYVCSSSYLLKLLTKGNRLQADNECIRVSQLRFPFCGGPFRSVASNRSGPIACSELEIPQVATKVSDTFTFFRRFRKFEDYKYQMREDGELIIYSINVSFGSFLNLR